MRQCRDHETRKRRLQRERHSYRNQDPCGFHCAGLLLKSSWDPLWFHVPCHGRRASAPQHRLETGEINRGRTVDTAELSGTAFYRFYLTYANP